MLYAACILYGIMFGMLLYRALTEEVRANAFGTAPLVNGARKRSPPFGRVSTFARKPLDDPGRERADALASPASLSFHTTGVDHA